MNFLARSLSRRARKSFAFEQLESRSLMASDTVVATNFYYPEDANASGDVSSIDALVVINQLARAGSSSSATGSSTALVDTNGDKSVTALDALLVINYISRNGGSTSGVPSAVPVSTRIEQLESSIASDELPANLTLDDAITVLATLRAGGRPEFGQTFSNGKVHDRSEDTGSSDDSNDATENRFLDKLVTRLTAAGVSEDIITTISTEVTDAETAGDPLTIDEIRDRLTELGVDVAKVFPSHDQSMQQEFLTRLTNRLTSAGASEDVIKTITGEITTAGDSGTPLTVTQIKTRLTELGIDVTKVFPNRTDSDDKGDLLTKLQSKLTEAGVDESVITTISDEIKAAATAGTPLTPEQIAARLTELGVDVTKIFPPKSDTGVKDDFLTKLQAKLTEAGVDESIITTISDEIKTAATAGTPLTPDQIAARLTELGVDVSTLFPEKPDDGGDHSVPPLPPIVDALSRKLTDAGVAKEIVTTIVKEVLAAGKAGEPLTPEEILARLTELGVDVSSIDLTQPAPPAGTVSGSGPKGPGSSSSTSGPTGRR